MQPSISADSSRRRCSPRRDGIAVVLLHTTTQVLECLRAVSPKQFSSQHAAVADAGHDRGPDLSIAILDQSWRRRARGGR